MFTGVGPDEFEKIDLQTPSDKILFAAAYYQFPLFFTRHNGLVCVTASDFDPADFMNASLASETFNSKFDLSLGGGGGGTGALNISGVFSPSVSMAPDTLTVYDLDPEEIYNESTGALSQMKAAFIYYLKKNISTCNGILKELFPDDVTLVETDSLLDK